MRDGGEPTPRISRALQILQTLGVDEATQTATRLSEQFDGSPRAVETYRKQWGKEVTDLLIALHRMSGVGTRVRREPGSEAPAQVETLRRMLLALADDLRVVVMQLALHISDLEGLTRRMTSSDAPELAAWGRSLGEETLLVQAPLANRLGIWQLKWLMEDLAFRMTEPQAYREIARQLDETRQEREAFVTTTIARLRHFLDQAAIHGEVAGRPKHLYSIYRKLNAKGLQFDQLMDIRAFRILGHRGPVLHRLGVFA